MKMVIQQYYAIMEDKIGAPTFSKLWAALQQKLGASYLDLKLERLCQHKRKQLLTLIPKHLGKRKAAILSIQLTDSKIEQLREVLLLLGIPLLMLVRIPVPMNEQELFIPLNVMRDLV